MAQANDSHKISPVPDSILASPKTDTVPSDIMKTNHDDPIDDAVAPSASSDDGQGLFVTGDSPAPSLHSPFVLLGGTRAAPTEDEPLFVPETDMAVSNNMDHTAENNARITALQKRLVETFRLRRLQTPAPDSARPNEDLTCDDTSDNRAVVAPDGDVSRLPDGGAEKFAKIKSDYESHVAAGTVTFRDEIAYMQAETAEQIRLAKVKADEEYDQAPSEVDETLLPSATANVQPPAFEEGDYEGDIAPVPKKRKRTARDDGDDSDIQAPPKRRGRPKGSKNKKKDEDVLARAQVATTAKGGKGRKKDETAKSNGKAVSKGIGGVTITNVDSIYGTNVFVNTEATRNLADQPLHSGGTRKAEALKALIASIPEKDRRVASRDKRLLDKAIKAFTGTRSVSSANDGTWKVRGMRSTLKHYQIIAVGWMREREASATEPRGGILADDMGLGKTVMMLANIVNGRPGKDDPKATLIVASPALVTQWVSEIDKHVLTTRENTGVIGTVIQYRAGHKVTSNNVEQILASADIVLTTYTEVCRSYPKAIAPSSLTTPQQRDEWWKAHYEAERGVLHRVTWHRVVLEEAHAIKNHRSHTSLGCRALMAKHHWCITGTPVVNELGELYPYFKFLREPSTGSYRLFKENFCSPDDPEGKVKLGVFLSKIMCRRTHADQLFSARLLDLPAPTDQTVWLDFNPVERAIYEIVKSRFVARINEISKAGGRSSLEREYNHIWTMVLRLRQIASHALLVQGTVNDLLEREDFEKLNRLAEAECDAVDNGTALLGHLRGILKRCQNAKAVDTGLSGAVIIEADVVPIGVTANSSSADLDDQVGGNHGRYFRFSKYLKCLQESATWESIKERTICCGCRQKPIDPQITDCFHIYCAQCAADLQHFAARRGSDQAQCSECGSIYSSVEPCLEPEEVLISSDANDSPKNKKSGKNSKKDDDVPGIKDWLELNGEVAPSAKTIAAKAQIMNWLETDPDCKIIVYSQFIPMLRILAKVCQVEGWDVVRYDGTMSHEARAKTIVDFNRPEKKIMLASLKCGGLGLNLTMASRVLVIDPWWNSAVEQQAFCRVFRIGQSRPTQLTRLVIRNTIDSKMHDICHAKRIEIDEAIESRHRYLDVMELMRLFGGDVREDGEGKPFIFPEKTDEPIRNEAGRVIEEVENPFMDAESTDRRGWRRR